MMVEIKPKKELIEIPESTHRGCSKKVNESEHELVELRLNIIEYEAKMKVLSYILYARYSCDFKIDFIRKWNAKSGNWKRQSNR